MATYRAQWVDRAGRVQTFDFNRRRIDGGWVLLTMDNPPAAVEEVMLPPSLGDQVTVEEIGQ